MTPRTIALLSDLGTRDPFVGVMKGVIARLTPEAQVIDLTHEIPPGDVREAAFRLWQSVPYFPSETVFVVVVDPGVGTERRPVVIAWPEFTCVGPDNGVFTYLLAAAGPYSAYRLHAPIFQTPNMSSTFHGRDIFAPAAAHLVSGEEPEKLGPPAPDLVRFDLPRLELVEGPAVHGEILHEDRFGNLITTLGHLRIEEEDMLLEPWLPHCAPARLPRAGLRLLLPNGARLELKAAYADVAVGEALAYVGSDGLLEIGINQGRAADTLPLKPGQEVILGYQRRTTA
jgi:S-adenosylmethionine hydrolase